MEYTCIHQDTILYLRATLSPISPHFQPLSWVLIWESRMRHVVTHTVFMLRTRKFNRSTFHTVHHHSSYPTSPYVQNKVLSGITVLLYSMLSVNSKRRSNCISDIFGFLQLSSSTGRVAHGTSSRYNPESRRSAGCP